MRPTINLLILNVMPLLYSNKCNSASNLNIITTLSVLKPWKVFIFFKDHTYFRALMLTLCLTFIRKKDTYNGEGSGHRIMRVTNTFWHL